MRPTMAHLAKITYDPHLTTRDDQRVIGTQLWADLQAQASDPNPRTIIQRNTRSGPRRPICSTCGIRTGRTISQRLTIAVPHRRSTRTKGSDQNTGSDIITPGPCHQHQGRTNNRTLNEGPISKASSRRPSDPNPRNDQPRRLEIRVRRPICGNQGIRTNGRSAHIPRGQCPVGQSAGTRGSDHIHGPMDRFTPHANMLPHVSLHKWTDQRIDNLCMHKHLCIKVQMSYSKSNAYQGKAPSHH